MTEPRAELVAALRRDPARTALLVDFDGTLAPIVEDPAESRPVAGAAEALDVLAARYALVAVVSGRPAGFLRDHLGSGPALVGLYGLEQVRDGEVLVDPAVAPWRAIVDEAAAAAEAELPSEVGVEHKGLSLTLHVRTCPEHAAAVEAWAAAGAGRWGLRHGTAKMSAELHPPVEHDKGTVVSALVAQVSARTACFVGDDVGDLPAFRALDRFAEAGGEAHKVVVASTEVAPELLAVADLTLDGPGDVLAMLRSLA
ncbi:MAG: trehalose-phosphatase [Acidimicrobiia bacterium]